jgi:hypothetical protein
MLSLGKGYPFCAARRPISMKSFACPHQTQGRFFCAVYLHRQRRPISMKSFVCPPSSTKAATRHRHKKIPDRGRGFVYHSVQ